MPVQTPVLVAADPIGEVLIDVTPHQGNVEMKKFVMQQLPVGWVQKKARIFIGPGALVDPNILLNEIEIIHRATGEDIRHRLLVDYRAYLHWPQFATRSKESGRHELIGATGKGCSEALISRLRLRGQEDFTVGHHASKVLPGVPVGDVEMELNDAYDMGAKIQLEGTQGQLLDLCLGPYPYTTHKQTGPAVWLAEAGLSPNLPLDIVMVLRTFPIRVAGNSGPLRNEISWPALARQINNIRIGEGQTVIVASGVIEIFEDAVREAAKGFDKPAGSDGLDQHLWSPEDRVKYRDTLSHLNATAMANLPDHIRTELARLFEMTTVTKKLRRVAEFNFEEARKAARQVRPSRVVITFLNYLFPERWATSDRLTDEEYGWISEVESACKAPVMLVNRGPLPSHFVEA